MAGEIVLFAMAFVHRSGTLLDTLQGCQVAILGKVKVVCSDAN